MKKTKLTTTLRLLHEHGACSAGYRKLAQHLGGVDAYGADTPINLLVILASNGVNDMAWCFRATQQNSATVARLFAADCAAAVLPIYETCYPGDDRPRRAIQVARDYAHGTIDDAARDSAMDAARDAAMDAAGGARSAARSAAMSAWSAARFAWDSAGDAARSARDAARSARDAAMDAARDAAMDAARDAAMDAARSARSAAMDASRFAGDAAWSAGDAAWSAARFAGDATWSAGDAAWSAAWDSAMDAAMDAARSARSAAMAASGADQADIARRYLAQDRPGCEKHAREGRLKGVKNVDT